MKRCPRCGETKHADAFARNRARHDGLSGYCRACNAEEQRDRVARDPEAHRASHRLAQKRHRYGLTDDEYRQMVADAAGVCPLCRRTADRPLHVDHDHKTGKVRGLICDTCNRGLGYFQDDPENLRRAAAYLEEHR